MFVGPLLGLIATVVSLRVNFLVGAAITVPTLYLYLRSLRKGPERRIGGREREEQTAASVAE